MRQHLLGIALHDATIMRGKPFCWAQAVQPAGTSLVPRALSRYRMRARNSCTGTDVGTDVQKHNLLWLSHTTCYGGLLLSLTAGLRVPAVTLDTLLAYDSASA